MTAKDIINKVKSLDLPAGQFIVYGSCPLAVLGIRETNDIDLLVTPAVLVQLHERGWQRREKGKKTIH
ncbi:hypothetical protein KA093_00140 [Candidatus Saccharibacteria bacterium]|nr:hypothetical protein [Candidatus Saccharibacteria bacterium]